MIEEFRDIKGYEGLYQVSSLGRVKSLKRKNRLKEKFLSSPKDNNGYLMVNLYKNNTKKSRKVHKLVAIAFLNHTPCKHILVIDHINNIKSDNRVVNLQVITQRENANKKHIKSSSKYVGVSWHKTRLSWQSSILINGKQKHLGNFTYEYQAHLAYQKALKKL